MDDERRSIEHEATKIEAIRAATALGEQAIARRLGACENIAEGFDLQWGGRLARATDG